MARSAVEAGAEELAARATDSARAALTGASRRGRATAGASRRGRATTQHGGGRSDYIGGGGSDYIGGGHSDYIGGPIDYIGGRGSEYIGGGEGGSDYSGGGSDYIGVGSDFIGGGEFQRCASLGHGTVDRLGRRTRQH